MAIRSFFSAIVGGLFGTFRYLFSSGIMPTAAEAAEAIQARLPGTTLAQANQMVNLAARSMLAAQELQTAAADEAIARETIPVVSGISTAYQYSVRVSFDSRWGRQWRTVIVQSGSNKTKGQVFRGAYDELRRIYSLGEGGSPKAGKIPDFAFDEGEYEILNVIRRS